MTALEESGHTRSTALNPPEVPNLAAQGIHTRRHSTVVRVTHWLVVASVLGLILSGAGILISHPRLYWGETGAVGAPSLVDLPIPFVLGPSVWNRPIHFLFAWSLVLTGLAYVLAGFLTAHFRKDLLPAKTELNWNRIRGTIADHLRWRRTSADDSWTYNVVQRLSYLIVVFALFPSIVWTGLAMSPGADVGVPHDGDRARRPSVGAHAPFRLCQFADALPDRSHRHALSWSVSRVT